MTEPPIWKSILTIVLIALLTYPIQASASPTIARAFYYGLGDGYSGEYHAAHWHRETPEGWPEVVDTVHYGVATSDWEIPFGTEICLEVISFPSWADDEYDELVGNIVCGIVVDRMPRWVEHRFGPSVDVWPAMARELMGVDFERIGTVRVRVDKLERNE